MKRCIWWIRRDLRMADNPALHAALCAADEVIPLFILDPALLGAEWVGPRRVAFLMDGLRALDADLRKRGGQLVLRYGDPVAELTAAVREWGVSSICAEADYSPYAQRRDRANDRIEAPLSRISAKPRSLLVVAATGYCKDSDHLFQRGQGLWVLRIAVG